MKKLAFVFAFLVGSIGIYASEGIQESNAAEYLLDIEVPLEIGVPDQIFVLSNLVTNSTVLGLLEQVAGLIDEFAGLLLPDKITFDILGVPNGLIITNFGVDVSAWEIQLSELAFNAIAGTEGGTVSVDVDLLGIVRIVLVISVLGA